MLLSIHSAAKLLLTAGASPPRDIPVQGPGQAGLRCHSHGLCTTGLFPEPPQLLLAPAAEPWHTNAVPRKGPSQAGAGQCWLPGHSDMGQPGRQRVLLALRAGRHKATSAGNSSLVKP